MAFHGRNLFRVTSFIFLATLVFGQFTVTPRNTWTFIGEKTVLECCSRYKNVTLIWRKYLETGRAQKICSKGDDCPYDGNYIIENSTPGCSNLVIESTSGRDSTYFECAIDGTGDKAAAYVIPYSCRADNNNQSDFVEGDIVTFRWEVLCKDKLQFSSYWMNEHGKIIKWNNFTGSCVSTRIVSAQRPELKAYTLFLQFHMNPNLDDQFDKTNANITWTSRKEPVAYPVTNINIKASLQDNSGIQDLSDSITITCYSDGYPSPDYLWLGTDDSEISRGPNLTIKSTETGHYKCVATNSIRGRQHSTSSSILIIASKNVAKEVCNTDVIPYLNLFFSAIIVLMLSILSYNLLIKTKINVESVESQGKEPASSVEVSDGDAHGISSNVHFDVPIAPAHSPVQRRGGLRADYETSEGVSLIPGRDPMMPQTQV